MIVNSVFSLLFAVFYADLLPCDLLSPFQLVLLLRKLLEGFRVIDVSHRILPRGLYLILFVPLRVCPSVLPSIRPYVRPSPL